MAIGKEERHRDVGLISIRRVDRNYAWEHGQRVRLRVTVAIQGDTRIEHMPADIKYIKQDELFNSTKIYEY